MKTPYIYANNFSIEPSDVAEGEHMSCICTADQRGLVVSAVHAVQCHTWIKTQPA